MAQLERSAVSMTDSSAVYSEALADVAPPKRATAFEYKPLDARGVRWYWSKPTFSAKGASRPGAGRARRCLPPWAPWHTALLIVRRMGAADALSAACWRMGVICAGL